MNSQLASLTIPRGGQFGFGPTGFRVSCESCKSVATRRKWVWIANGEISGQSARSCSYRGIELEVSTLGLPHRTIDPRNRVRPTAHSLVVRSTERSVLCMGRSQEPGCLLCTETRYMAPSPGIVPGSSYIASICPLSKRSCLAYQCDPSVKTS